MAGVQDAHGSVGYATPAATPLVTVAIPVYRRFEFLPGALASVEAQDYGPIELLVSTRPDDVERVRGLVEAHYSRPARVVGWGGAAPSSTGIACSTGPAATSHCCATTTR